MEPVILDLANGETIAGVDVEADRDAVHRDAQRFAQEADKEPDHRDVRIDEPDRVSVLRAFGPIQEAACEVKCVALACACPAFLLVDEPPGATPTPPLVGPSLDDFRVLW